MSSTISFLKKENVLDITFRTKSDTVEKYMVHVHFYKYIHINLKLNAKCIVYKTISRGTLKHEWLMC